MISREDANEAYKLMMESVDTPAPKGDMGALQAPLEAEIPKELLDEDEDEIGVEIDSDEAKNPSVIDGAKKVAEKLGVDKVSVSNKND